YRSAWSAEWKLIEAFETGKLLLYSFARDIGETNDLSGNEPEKLAELRGRLKAAREDVGAAPMRPNLEYEGERK
ncbi:MAG: hypothetical protein ACR2NU_00470, partial [Aeoliella sp.]